MTPVVADRSLLLLSIDDSADEPAGAKSLGLNPEA